MEPVKETAKEPVKENVKTKNNPGARKENGGGSKGALVAFILTTLLFLGASGYLYYDNTRIKKEMEAQRLKIESLNIMKRDLEKTITTFQEDIRQWEGKHQTLSEEVADANSKLEEKEAAIKNLIRKNSDTKKIKSELEALKAEKENFLRTISELEAKLSELTLENDALKARAVQLDQQITTLQQRNAMLEKKVEVASALKTNNVIVIGEKKGKKGYTPTTLKKAERLLITFDLMENKVAEPGDKNIYITVTNPSGKVLENAGSGTFTNKESNIAMPYTLVHQVNFSNSEQKEKVPVDIAKEDKKPGNYTIEFYCDGVLCGIKKLAIK